MAEKTLEEPDLSDVGDLDFPWKEEDCTSVNFDRGSVNELKAVVDFLENLIEQLDNHHTTVWCVHQNIIRQLAKQKKASEETQSGA